MKISIKRHIGTILFDARRFVSIYKKSLSIGDALRSGKVLLCKEGKAEDFMTMAHLCLDWSKILEKLGSEKDIRLEFYVCQYTDKVEYEEGVISPHSKEFKLTEHLTNGEGILIFNNIIPHHDFTLKMFFYNTTYKFGNKDWILQA